MDKQDVETMADALRTYGVGYQLMVAVEELNELSRALVRYQRGVDNEDEVIDEIADVLIVVGQLNLMFNDPNDAVGEALKRKLKRLRHKIDFEKNQRKITDYGGGVE